MPLDAAQLASLLDAGEPEQVALGRTVATEQQPSFEVLKQFLADHPGDVRAVEVVCGVIRGIASKGRLEPNRDIYRDVLSADMSPETIRPQAIKVLAFAVAMPQCEYWVKLHGRRLLRRLWEMRSSRGLSPDVVHALEEVGVAWELPEIDTLDEAWAIMLALCTTEYVDVVPAGGCDNVWEHVAHGTAVAGDVVLARFMENWPSVLERAVLDRIEELAQLPTNDRSYRVLGKLFDTGFGMGPSHWAHTHAAWDASLGLATFTRAQTEDLFDALSKHNSFNVARAWLERDPGGYDALPREMIDVFRALIANTPLPDILPPELDQQTPEQIEIALATYCGITVPQLYQRLLPNPNCTGGFIQPGEHLGALIANDADTLRSLGISRHELADRIAEHIGPPDGQWHEAPPFQTCAMAFMGHQHDPFHVYDVYSFNGHLGSIDFQIRRGELELSGGTLQLSLIRRLCFFGGPGCYRIDPAKAVEVLQLR